MRMTGMGLLGLAVICLAAGTPREVGVGDKAPEIKADKLLNTKLSSTKDLKGSLVLLDFFAHW